MEKISNKLHAHVIRKKWSAAIDRIDSNPNEAQFMNRYGETVLHEACRFDPPAPLELITSLIAAFPDAVSIQNSYGFTPLHFACLRSSADVVRILLNANVSIVNLKDSRNHCALELLYWGGIIRQAADKGDLLRDTLRPKRIPSYLLKRFEKLPSIWDTACLLVKATAHGSIEQPLPNGKVWRILHACARNEDCSSNLIRLAMIFHSEQLQEADEEGNLPLHIAASAGPTTVITAFPVVGKATKKGSFSPRGQIDHSIKLISAAYPTAAQVRNNQGKLPFHLVIESRRMWDTDGVEAMLEVFPGALAEIDEATRLFPFMLAASVDSSLTLVYILIRACPELGRFIGS